MKKIEPADPLLDEVEAVQRKLEAEFGNDPAKLLARPFSFWEETMTRNPQTGDPLIDDVRRVKREISAEFDHDPAKLIAFLAEYQKQFAGRLAESPPDGTKGKSAV